nr:MAG TPA: hypothetical protein [Caudoviricetes sp.]
MAIVISAHRLILSLSAHVFSLPLPSENIERSSF